MRTFLQRCWRVPLTAMSFALFGLGGLVLGAIVFPAIRMLSPREATGRRCRRAIQRSFRLFLVVLSVLRLMRFEFCEEERLLHLHGRLVVANHPSLLDVVVLVSRLPDARCVVKHAVWRSPFLGTVVRLAGYVPSVDPQDVVDRTARLLRAGETVVLFPEGTRTRKDRPAAVRRGAALILLRSGRPAVPVRLRVRPPALGKMDSLARLPPEAVHVRMTVGEEVHPSTFGSHGSEREKSRSGSRILERALGLPPADRLDPPMAGW
ncbi:MAG: 1-acyl-sn-glycerol-3-phosphate acyltransferase [Holophagales bacterium]|nr:1-acyl-sn-glycerol-3-phosphate acyltransferase [Holophagales bacterium]MYI33978.1 1-acyl-sn-glycerol-3-phosphate acyltransferase [Holophagales bacterium]